MATDDIIYNFHVATGKINLSTLYDTHGSSPRFSDFAVSSPVDTYVSTLCYSRGRGGPGALDERTSPSERSSVEIWFTITRRHEGEDPLHIGVPQAIFPLPVQIMGIHRWWRKLWSRLKMFMAVYLLNRVSDSIATIFENQRYLNKFLPIT